MGASLYTPATAGGQAAGPSIMGHILTLTSGTPLPTADQTAQGTIYLTPFTSRRIPLQYAGTWIEHTTAEVSLTPGATLTSGANYDVFAYSTNGTTVALELLAWTNDTTRATAIVNDTTTGLRIKSGDATRLYVGTIRTTSTSQTEDSEAKRFVYNAYHRRRRGGTAKPGASWTIQSVTIAQANGAAAWTKREFVLGHPSWVEAEVATGFTTCAASNAHWVMIGLDETTARNAESIGQMGGVNVTNGEGGARSSYCGVVTVGYHALTFNEKSDNATNAITVNAYGDTSIAGFSFAVAEM